MKGRGDGGPAVSAFRKRTEAANAKGKLAIVTPFLGYARLLFPAPLRFFFDPRSYNDQITFRFFQISLKDNRLRCCRPNRDYGIYLLLRFQKINAQIRLLTAWVRLSCRVPKSA